jgi:hypothetical protein
MIFYVDYKEGLLQPPILTSYVARLWLKISDMRAIILRKMGFRKGSRTGSNSGKSSNGATVVLNY